MWYHAPAMPAPGKFDKTLITGDYPTLEAAFQKAVASFKQDDPLQPLIVLVPSHLLGMHLSRGLAACGIAHINTRFMTLGDFAEAIAAPAILRSGRIVAPALAREALISDIVTGLKTANFYFTAIADKSGFHEAILGTIDDLKRACIKPESLDKTCRKTTVREACHPGKLRDILKVWNAYEARMQKLGWYDNADRDEMASGYVSQSDLVTGAAAIIVYGFYDLGAMQRKIVKTCSDMNHVVALVPFEDRRAFDFSRPVIEWLRAEGFAEDFKEKKAPGIDAGARAPALENLAGRIFNPDGPVGDIEKSLEIISAPGEVREVREIVRLISREVLGRGVAPHEIAVLTRRSHPYTGLFRDLLDGMGVTPYILEGLKLKDTRPGKSLRLLLEILRHNFSRATVIEFATYARLRADISGADGRTADPAAIWDIVSMDSGIVDGRDGWKTHLAETLIAVRAGGAAQYDERDVRSLIEFFQHLERSLSSIQKAKTWSDKAKALAEALTSLIETEKETDEVLAAIRDLSVLDEIGTEPRNSDLYDFVDDLLSDSTKPTARFQRNGPSVISLIAARGIPFKVVILPGLVEKFFPAPARQDAIMLDSERQALNRALTGSEADPIELRGAPHLDRERLFYRLAVGAATQKLVLTFPRLDISTARERVPSSFVLATIEAATGERADFNSAETFPGFVRVPLARLGTDEPHTALDPTEFDIAIASEGIATRKPDAIKYLQANSDFFHASLNLEASRWSKRVFTAYDGILAGAEALGYLKDIHSIVGTSVGPTRLETYASCPYRYYLGSILDLKALVEPERQDTISALDRGSLIHSLLWRLFTKIRNRKKGIPFGVEPTDLPLLHEALAETFEDFEKRGITGYPLMWEMEKADIAVRMEELFDEEIRPEGEDEQIYLPAYFEIRYGMKARGSDESDISDESPVPVKFGDRQIALRGKIDRIDLSPDLAHARIVDYKTGKGKPKYKPKDLMQGTSLQLALYLRAAYEILNRIHEEVSVDYAEYYCTSHAGKKRHIRFDYAELMVQRKELAFILDTIADGIEAGSFFAHPQETCQYCDFVRVCGAEAERETVYERKADDKRIKNFRTMKDMGSDD